MKDGRFFFVGGGVMVRIVGEDDGGEDFPMPFRSWPEVMKKTAKNYRNPPSRSSDVTFGGFCFETGRA